MIKITRVKNEWLVDEEQKLFGRSIYFVLNAENIKKFEKQKKRFKMSDENFEEVKKQIVELYEKNL